MKRVIIALLASVALLPVHADKVWTLQECISYAVAHNLIIKQQEANQTSEFQNFVATFMYADLKARDYMKYVKRFVASFKRHYIADAVYFKLLRYFYESDSDIIDKDLAELMTSVYMKSHTPGHGKHWNKHALLKKFLDVKKTLS